MGFLHAAFSLLFFKLLYIQTNEDCVLMRDTGEWQDASCDESHEFVCESVPGGNICDNCH